MSTARRPADAARTELLLQVGVDLIHDLNVLGDGDSLVGELVEETPRGYLKKALAVLEMWDVCRPY